MGIKVVADGTSKFPVLEADRFSQLYAKTDGDRAHVRS